MPTFSYEVRQEGGQVERGTRQGASEEAVARELRAQGYLVVSVQRSAPETPAVADALVRHVLGPVFAPVSSKSKAQFFASLRALLSAGMNISEAMGRLSGRTRTRALARAAREMEEAAVRGRPMTHVMRRYPAAFNEATLAVMEAGEQSGLLEQTAGRLAGYFDRVFELEQTYRWQTFYPKVLLVALVLIPSAQVLVLQGFRPWLQYVLAIAIPALFALAVLWYGGRLLFRIPPIRKAWDGLKIMIPWFGSLSRRMATARWARALSMLLGAGVPVHRSLVAAASASGNAAMEAALEREAAGVFEGKTVGEVVAASGQIPDMALDMLTTSERTGSFEGALDKVADYYESETDVGGKQTAIAVGLVIYLIVAGIIAFMVISFWGGYVAGYGSFME
jgi:type II secretory pathway component PulF